LFIYDSNHVKAVHAHEKVTVTGEKSNQIGGLEAEPPAAGGQRRVGVEPLTLQRFFYFFPKYKTFLYTFWSKFLLKNVLLKCVVDAARTWYSFFQK